MKPTFIDSLTVVPETKQTPKAAKKAAPKELPEEPVKLAAEIKQTGAVQMKASAPKAPVVQTRKAVVAKKKPLQLDYTQESFFDDWIHNLAVQEEVKKPTSFPLTPRPSPKAARKRKLVLDYTCESFFLDWIHNLDVPLVVSLPAKPAVANEVDQEDLFGDEKDSRRRDFAKVAKIKDKKRTQAARRSIGKRIK